MATMPTRAMKNAAEKVLIPTSISYSAGGYVCNHIMYGLLDFIADKDMIGGFIHIPATPMQAVGNDKMPSMRSEDVAIALISMLAVM